MGVLPAHADSISSALAAGQDVALWPGGERDSLRAWSQRDEAVLVEGEPIGAVVEALELVVEPVGEFLVDLRDGLADRPPARRRAAAARLVRDHQRDPLIEGAGQQGDRRGGQRQTQPRRQHHGEDECCTVG